MLAGTKVHGPYTFKQHSRLFSVCSSCRVCWIQGSIHFPSSRSFDVDMTGTGCSLPVKPGQWLSGLMRKECQDEEEGRQ